MILLNSLSHSYDHIVNTMLYDKETLIMDEVTSILLSNEIRKRPNQEMQIRSGLVVTGRKERGVGKKIPGSSKACHFCHKKDHWKNACKHR